MRHGFGLSKLNRSPSHRRAVLRNLATSFLRMGRFETTLTKAKALRRVVEPLIALGREDTLPARRKAYSYLQDKDVVHKLFAEIGPKFKERPGGYTRVVRSRIRHGDSAPMAIIALVEEELKGKGTSKKKGARGTGGRSKAGSSKNAEAAETEAAAS